MTKSKKILLSLLALVVAGVAYASQSTWYRRDHTNALGQIYVLENDGTTTQLGALKFGSAESSPALPTTSTADDMGVKVPFYNGYNATVTQGAVIVASTTATSTIWGTLTTALATTTVLGVSDGTYTSGSIGWMTIRGYCRVLTTGTVNVGDILVTTTTTAGYAGTTTGTQVVGTAIGKAVSPGTAAGGLTTVLIGL